jgi:hypothetical protein
MAGKTFVAGEVLTAADMNTLVSQDGGDTITAGSASEVPLTIKDASGQSVASLQITDNSDKVGVDAWGGGLIRIYRAAAGSSLFIQQNIDTSSPSRITFYKSRGSFAAPSVVQNGDDLGTLTFHGYSAEAGTYLDAAWIRASVDGTPDSSGDTTDMPGRLTFLTTADGSSTPSERMRITNAGNVLIGTTSTLDFSSTTNEGWQYAAGSNMAISRADGLPVAIQRSGTDGVLIGFYNDTVNAGDISVSGATVSYNAFMGSHYTEINGAAPLRGTVMESTDELVEEVFHQQDRLPKCKVSDTAGSKSVYGVYFSEHEKPEGYEGPIQGHLVAALGASWVRVAAGVTVNRGDLLESNGDGCARVQADDVIRSSTIGKVSAATVVETYEDGSYLVPVVLMCG